MTGGQQWPVPPARRRLTGRPGSSPRSCTPPTRSRSPSWPRPPGWPRAPPPGCCWRWSAAGWSAATTDGRFRPGEMFVRYAWRGGAEAGLAEVAQPFLDRLGAADRRDHQPRRGPRRPGRADRPGGQHVPDRRHQLGRPSGARCTAPRWARCCSPTARRRCRPAGWSARTDRTITSRAALAGRPASRSAAAATRSPTRSWSRDWSRWPRPSSGTAAVVVAALSVSAPASRLSPAEHPAVAAQCAAQAAALSAVLGHRPAEPLQPGQRPARRTGRGPQATERGAA